MKLLVTGADGFVGRWLVDELEQHGHDVHGLPGPQHGVDLCRAGEADQLVRDFAPELVVHLAARVGRAFGEDAPMQTVIDNAGMTVHVAKACGAHGVRLAYASSSEVYGDTWGVGWVADDRRPLASDVLPHNVYGLTKRWGEEACRVYVDEPTILRLSMPYGPGHPPGYGRAALTNFVWAAMRRRPLEVHADAERAWCWIGDTVRAIRYVLEHDYGRVRGEVAGRPGEAWNIGRSDNATSMHRVAWLACKQAGLSEEEIRKLVRVVDAPERQTVVKRLSTAKLASLGWRPTVELEEGVAAVHAYLLELERELERQAVDQARLDSIFERRR